MNSKKNIKDVCPLCSQSKKLIKSHIIPEGFYRPIYDEKGRVFFGSNMRNENHYLQKGRREQLLCKECDEGMGNYDKYGKEIILDTKKVEKIEIQDGVIFRHFNYNKFKLFHLSILLRAHYSKEVSLGINLSEQEAEELRKYILEEKAPKEYKYPMFAYRLTDCYGNYYYDGIITYGNFYEIEGGIKAAIFIFGGFAWLYIIDNIEPERWYKYGLKNLFLHENGELIILNYDIEKFFPLRTHDESINRILKYREIKMKNN